MSGETKRVNLPGSKSITQRALIAAALAGGVSKLEGALISEDSLLLLAALRTLGIAYQEEAAAITIVGGGGRFCAVEHPIDLGNNGTALRFLLSLTCLGEGNYTLDGNVRLRERPVGALVKALRGLGAKINCIKREGYVPLNITATGIGGGLVRFSDVDSSQYISSLLLSAPYAKGDIRICLEGKTVSEPYIKMTVKVMSDFGVSVAREAENTFLVTKGQSYQSREYSIEADASSATYFFALAMICQQRLYIPRLSRQSIQGDIGFLDIASSLGSEIIEKNGGIEIIGKPLRTGEMVFDMGGLPDAVPTLAVLCAFRRGRTIIKNVAHLRIKESDRIYALVSELNKIGVPAQEREDGLVIDGGGELQGAAIETYNDHRIAMSFALAAQKNPQITITDKECVNKSFPTFWEVLEQVCA
ncbi:MAG: 3-phosphoshikimate 1-carboxyvinyltransferase [Deltaproteobacteria bacterium]|nr:3-phosphoshikimate 1-carboxyvinyltransferase [Deltaproteobacteria bacterium]